MSESNFFANLTEEEKRIALSNVQFMTSDDALRKYYEVQWACNLGYHYFKKHDYKKAIYFFEECIKLYHKNVADVEQGECNSEFLKGIAEISGTDGIFLFHAKKNYYGAIYGIGYCYYHGWGVEKDYKKAYEYLKKAADEFDDADAQNLLGNMYFEGQGVEKNDELSAGYFEKAAVQGQMFAQNSLGRIYEFGLNQHLGKDIQKAVYWYKKAAAQGDDLATKNLIRIQGATNIKKINRTRVGDTRLSKILKKAKSGKIYSMYEIGEYYEKIDVNEAKKWFQKAADKGFSKAAEKLKKLAED